MNWMKHFLENRTDIEFTGYDIVPANIENHKRYFSGRNWNFEVIFNNLDEYSKYYLGARYCN